MSFSKRMKQSREKQGITLAELGRKIGKTEATVQRYESGNIKNLKNDTIENITSALNVNPAYLMGWIDEDPSNEDTIAAHLDGDDFTEEEQDTIAAHFDKEDLTDEEKQEVQDFINYLKSKRK